MPTKERRILIHNIADDTCAFCGFPATKGNNGASCPNCKAVYKYNDIFEKFVWEQDNILRCPKCHNEMFKIVYDRYQCPICNHQVVITLPEE